MDSDAVDLTGVLRSLLVPPLLGGVKVKVTILLPVVVVVVGGKPMLLCVAALSFKPVVLPQLMTLDVPMISEPSMMLLIVPNVALDVLVLLNSGVPEEILLLLLLILLLLLLLMLLVPLFLLLLLLLVLFLLLLLLTVDVAFFAGIGVASEGVVIVAVVVVIIVDVVDAADGDGDMAESEWVFWIEGCVDDDGGNDDGVVGVAVI